MLLDLQIARNIRSHPAGKIRFKLRFTKRGSRRGAYALFLPSCNCAHGRCENGPLKTKIFWVSVKTFVDILSQQALPEIFNEYFVVSLILPVELRLEKYIPNSKLKFLRPFGKGAYIHCKSGNKVHSTMPSDEPGGLTLPDWLEISEKECMLSCRPMHYGGSQWGSHNLSIFNIYVKYKYHK